MEKRICVFCSSSDAVNAIYLEAAAALGKTMAEKGWGLVYGGTTIGLMGAVARAVHESGGHVIGVVPETIHARGVAYQTADELIITPDLRQRKARMEELSDAFIALPGGFGTLEEVIEVLTLKQLQTHTKPIVMLNTGGFYDPLLALFQHFYEQRFAKPESHLLYHVAPDVPDALTYLDTYTPVMIGNKW